MKFGLFYIFVHLKHTTFLNILWNFVKFYVLFSCQHILMTEQ